MREVKFRAWDKKDKRWLFQDKEISALPDYLEIMCIDWESYDLTEYTGIKDKNGKRIYEGDIVSQDSMRTYLYQVLYGEFTDKAEGGCVGIDSFGWYYKEIKSEGEEMNLLNTESGCPESTEVIGNVFENPELLKGGIEGEVDKSKMC